MGVTRTLRKGWIMDRIKQAELVGELVSEERQYRHEVARLIQQQENDTRE